MPRDAEGNITTTSSFGHIKTLHDVIVDDKKDVIPLKVGGMAFVGQDEGEGVELTAGAATGVQGDNTPPVVEPEETP